MNKLRIVWLLTCIALAGCGGGMAKSTVQSSQVAIDSAISLEKERKMADAMKMVSSAIEAGGLNPDLLCEAYLLRARCYCAEGKLAEAESDIAAAEQGSPNPATWHYTRAMLLAKQNKTAESKAELAKAQRIDPKLKL